MVQASPAGTAQFVGTIDGCQGAETPITIINTVPIRQNRRLTFLNDFRRLNVALTRTKRLSIIIGDLYHLQQFSPVWKRIRAVF